MEETEEIYLDKPEIIQMRWGLRYKYNHGIFIDFVDPTWERTGQYPKNKYLIFQLAVPSAHIGTEDSLEDAKDAAINYLSIHPETRDEEMMPGQTQYGVEDPFRPADRIADCPSCFRQFRWNKEDGLIGQVCACGYVFEEGDE